MNFIKIIRKTSYINPSAIFINGECVRSQTIIYKLWFGKVKQVVHKYSYWCAEFYVPGYKDGLRAATTQKGYY